jgi:Xaa-Pro dipeptidase
MVQAGSDPPEPAQLGVGSTQGRQAWAPWPVGHVAAAGDALIATVAGRYAGYNAQGIQPVVLGPLPEDWGNAWQVHLNAWQRTWQVLRPGARLAEVEVAVVSSPNGELRARQTIHGCGLGDDMPLITSDSAPRSRSDNRVLKEGVCLAVKSYVTWTDEYVDKKLGWGDTVVITRDGARRLGARPHELIVRDQGNPTGRFGV